ncbi:MAG: hypothetical protein ACI8XV_002109, partial [Arenicella sp.]
GVWERFPLWLEWCSTKATLKEAGYTTAYLSSI